MGECGPSRTLTLLGLQLWLCPGELAEPGCKPFAGSCNPSYACGQQTMGCLSRMLAGPSVRNKDPMPMASPWH